MCTLLYMQDHRLRGRGAQTTVAVQQLIRHHRKGGLCDVACFSHPSDARLAFHIKQPDGTRICFWNINL
jgi:hypothetical protein